MITKLKLQVDLSNIMDVNITGKLIEEYRVYITVLEKDSRFEASNIGESFNHMGTGDFSIKSRWDEKIGSILYNGLLLPSVDKLGTKYEKLFKDDMERYYFLKKLYVAIEEWGLYWWSFKYDEGTKLIIKDNIWEVVCDSIYMGSIGNEEEDEIEDYGDIDDYEEGEWIIL